MAEAAILHDEVLREQWRRSLYRFFTECAWPALWPGVQYVDNWHVHAICEYLQALSKREIRHLIVNIAPRLLKSSIISQAFPAWEWASRPQLEFFTASYAKDIAMRDAVKSRDVIRSQLYQRAFGQVFQMAGDQDVKTRYTNDKAGSRIVSAPDAAGTAFGGNRVIIDDPINAKDASNVAANKTVVEWWKGAASTRLNDPRNDSIIVTHQRTFPDDLTGYLLETESDFTVLRLPMRYDPKIISLGTIVYADPRTKPGELLFPARLDEAEVSKIERRLGPFHVASQLQQFPEYRRGSMFDTSKLVYVDHAPPCIKLVRAWDLAATGEDEGGEARTAGLKVGITSDDRIVVFHGAAELTSPERQREFLREIAAIDGPEVPISAPQDPGQAGKVQVASLAKLLNNRTTHFSVESGDKMTRADAPASQVNVGNVWVVRGEWNHEFAEELRSFPMSSRKDYVDALSRAYHYLTGGQNSVIVPVMPKTDAGSVLTRNLRTGLPATTTRKFR